MLTKLIHVQPVKYPDSVHPSSKFLKGLGVVLLAGAVCYGFAFSMFMAEKWGFARADSDMLVVPLIGVPLLIIVAGFKIIASRSHDTVVEAQMELFRRASKTPIERWGSNGSGGAIAISQDGLFIIQGRLLASIPYTAIRYASWKIPGWDEVSASAGTLIGQLEADRHARHANNRARREAEAASGYFLDVQDVDHPHWQFQSTNETFLRQFHEAVTQGIAWFERQQPVQARA